MVLVEFLLTNYSKSLLEFTQSCVLRKDLVAALKIALQFYFVIVLSQCFSKNQKATYAVQRGTGANPSSHQERAGLCTLHRLGGSNKADTQKQTSNHTFSIQFIRHAFVWSEKGNGSTENSSMQGGALATLNTTITG